MITAIDRYLRGWGFVIHGRPKDAEPTWRDKATGRVVGQGEAIIRAREREARAKEDK